MIYKNQTSNQQCEEYNEIKDTIILWQVEDDMEDNDVPL